MVVAFCIIYISHFALYTTYMPSRSCMNPNLHLACIQNYILHASQIASYMNPELHSAWIQNCILHASQNTSCVIAKSPRPNYEWQTLQGRPESIHSIKFLKASKGYDVILYSQTTIPLVESNRNDKTSGVSTLPQVSTSILKKLFFTSLHCLAYIDISTKMAMQHMLIRGQLSLLKFWLSQKGPVMKTSLRIW